MKERAAHHRPRCPVIPPIVMLFSAFAPGQLAGQVTVELGAGITATSEMLSDSIVTPVSIGTDPGFAAAFRVGTRLDSANVLLVGLSLSRNTMVRESGSSSTALTSMNVWFPSVGLRHSFTQLVAVRGMIGAILYDAETSAGTPFRDGTSTQAAAGAGVTFTPSFTNGLALDLAWDVHRFNTPALKTEGFGGDKVVHRVTAMIQLGGINAK